MNYKKVILVSVIASVITLGAIFKVSAVITTTSGNNYPTSSFPFSDNDIINAGDINNITNYTGIRSATDTVSLQGQIYNISSSFVGGVLSLAHGGTGQVTTGTNGQVLTTNGDGTTKWASAATVAGTSTNIQFNDGGISAATSTFSYASSTHVLVTAGTSTPTFLPAGLVNRTFTYTGATSSFTVPSGVFSLQVNLRGAQGTTGTAQSGNAGGNAGLGASVTGTIPVVPGEILYLAVGAQPTSTVGGYGAGPNGGNGGVPVDGGVNGGAGGGPSWISTSSFYSSSTVLAIAAGGGGGGAGSTNADCGGGGGGGGGYGGGGGGGNCSANGGATSTVSTGIGGNGGNTEGQAGGIGTGGFAGGRSPGGSNAGVGGNGGSGAGGGDGLINAGGGGGSGLSFVNALLTSTSSSYTANASSGQIIISYAGSVTGNNNAGLITAPVNLTTTTITFAGNPWANANGVSCSITMNNATNTWTASSTLQAFSINFVNTITANQTFNYLCQGY